jgi:hypothetical protein
MLVSATHPLLYLLLPSDLGARLPQPAERYRDALEEVIRWSREYLCDGHPDLGRTGPVCPWARPSLDKQLLWLTVHPGADPPLDALAADVAAYGRWFRRLPPTTGRDAQYKAILILLPDLPPERAPEIIDTVHAAEKPGFVTDGLMLGQFYSTCDRPGVRNAAFRPLQSTVPQLTIRHMVAPDAGFLHDEARFLRAYLERFGDAVPTRLQSTIDEAVVRLGLDGGG